MKKIIFILVLILTIFCLSGCETTEQSKVTNKNDSMFIIVEDCYSWRVVYHKDTKVMYVVSYSRYTNGIFTLLVDENGNPLLWKGEE